MIHQIAGGGIQIKNRILGRVRTTRHSSQTHPTVTFFAGLHGNEPSGIHALKRLLAKLEPLRHELAGDVLCLAGNLPALESNQRFIRRDLNRIWTPDHIGRARQTDLPLDENVPEFIQQREILQIIDPLLESPPGPLYFIDLHTTSAPSVPFITLNDQLANRRFAMKFPLPAVLGLEEYLAGPMLCYLNEFGHIAIGFEAGQHVDQRSIDYHESFAWLTLVYANVLTEAQVPDFADHAARLKAATQNVHGIFEVVCRHAVESEDQFHMRPGFQNFQTVTKGDVIAQDAKGDIRIPQSGRIFMPLYQSWGNDGFFLVRRIPRWALALSSLLRQIHSENLLVWLPGVSHSPDQPETLIVNRRVARFLANEIFHLLGYRRKQIDGDFLIFSRREISTHALKQDQGSGNTIDQ